MKPCYLLLFFVFQMTMSCTVRVNGLKQGNDIDNDVREEIAAKVDTIFTSFKQSSSENIKGMLSNSIRNESAMLDTLVALKLLDDDATINIRDEFYFKNGPGSNLNTVRSTLNGYKYNFVFNILSMDTYVFLSTSYSKTTETDVLTTIVFGKEDDEWKIQSLNIYPYTYKGKSAPYYSKLSEEQLDYQHIACAYIYTVFASALAKPGGNNFHYEMEPQMSQLYSTITSEYNKLYPMPMVIDNVESKPKITSIGPSLTRLSIKPTPTVKYESRILDDIQQLEIENNKLHKELMTRVHDFKNISDSVVYDISFIKDNQATTMTLVKPISE